MKYTRKPLEVEAFQWMPGMKLPETITPSLLTEEYVIFKNKFGTHMARKGDFIVLYPDNVAKTMRQKEFEELFDKSEV